MRMHPKFKSANVKGRDLSEDLGVDEDNIKMVLRKIGWEIVDWMNMARDRGHWRALMNITLRVP
jgi:hypothetical protein